MTTLPAVVTLSDVQWRYAARVGLERRIASWGYRDRHGYDPADPIGDDVMGAIAEAALARHMGWKWNEINNFKEPDVESPDGVRVQVRYTRRSVKGQLIIRPPDPDDPDSHGDPLNDFYCLVRQGVNDRTLELSPLIWGYDAMRLGTVWGPNDRPVAVFVERSVLLAQAALGVQG